MLLLGPFFLGFRTLRIPCVIYTVVPLCRNNHLVETLHGLGYVYWVFGEHCESFPHLTAHRAWQGVNQGTVRDLEHQIRFDTLSEVDGLTRR